MAAAKQSGRAGPPAGRAGRPRLASRWLWGTGLTVATGIYWLVFLSLPVSPGAVDPEGRPISRGGLLVSALLLPDALVSSWFDGGRLPSDFLDRVPLILATVGWLALAAVVGLPTVAGLPRVPDRAARLETFTLATLAGLAILSTLVLTVGLAGGLSSRWPLLIACTAVGALAAWLAWPERGRLARQYLALQSLGPGQGAELAQEAAPAELDAAANEASREVPTGMFDRGLQALIVGLTCFLALVVMLGSWVPSAEFDVLEYHLQAPKEFFQLGSIRFLPHNIYANMPLGAEMHSLAMMTLVGQPDAWIAGLMGKSILAAMTLLAAGLLGSFVSRRLGGLAGWLAAGLWLASPGLAQSSMLGLIDGVLATFVVAAAIATTHALECSKAWRTDGERLPTCAARLSQVGLNWWFLAGLFSGAAAATKYPGLVFAVAPVVASLGLLGAVRYIRPVRSQDSAAAVAEPADRAPAIAAAALLIGLGLSLTCVPWYAKNWVLAGNPVTPLAANIFGGKTLAPEKIAQWQRAHRVPAAAATVDGQPPGWIDQFRAAARDSVRLILSSPFVQPAMICGLVFGVATLIWRRELRRSRWSLWLCWSLWIVLVWWLATHRIDRFWLPLVGLWAGLAAFGLSCLRRGTSVWLAQAIGIFGLLYGSVLSSTSLVGDNRFFVSIAALRDDLGDEQQVPRIHREQAWINEHLSGGNNRVLLIGQAGVFEYRVPIVYSTCFDTNPGEIWLRDRSAAEQREALHANGITHIMIDWNEISRYRSPGNYGFSDWPQPADVQRLVDGGVASRVDWGIPEADATLLRVE